MVACPMENRSAADVDMRLVALELDMGPKDECKSSVLKGSLGVTSASCYLP